MDEVVFETTKGGYNLFNAGQNARPVVEHVLKLNPVSVGELMTEEFILPKNKYEIYENDKRGLEHLKSLQLKFVKMPTDATIFKGLNPRKVNDPTIFNDEKRIFDYLRNSPQSTWYSDLQTAASYLKEEIASYWSNGGSGSGPTDENFKKSSRIVMYKFHQDEKYSKLLLNLSSEMTLKNIPNVWTYYSSLLAKLPPDDPMKTFCGLSFGQPPNVKTPNIDQIFLMIFKMAFGGGATYEEQLEAFEFVNDFLTNKAPGERLYGDLFEQYPNMWSYTKYMNINSYRNKYQDLQNDLNNAYKEGKNNYTNFLYGRDQIRRFSIIEFDRLVADCLCHIFKYDSHVNAFDSSKNGPFHFVHIEDFGNSSKLFICDGYIAGNVNTFDQFPNVKFTEELSLCNGPDSLKPIGTILFDIQDPNIDIKPKLDYINIIYLRPLKESRDIGLTDRTKNKKKTALLDYNASKLPQEMQEKYRLLLKEVLSIQEKRKQWQDHGYGEIRKKYFDDKLAWSWNPADSANLQDVASCLEAFNTCNIKYSENIIQNWKNIFAYDRLSRNYDELLKATKSAYDISIGLLKRADNLPVKKRAEFYSKILGVQSHIRAYYGQMPQRLGITVIYNEWRDFVERSLDAHKIVLKQIDLMLIHQEEKMQREMNNSDSNNNSTNSSNSSNNNNNDSSSQKPNVIGDQKPMKIDNPNIIIIDDDNDLPNEKLKAKNYREKLDNIVPQDIRRTSVYQVLLDHYFRLAEILDPIDDSNQPDLVDLKRKFQSEWTNVIDFITSINAPYEDKIHVIKSTNEEYRKITYDYNSIIANQSKQKKRKEPGKKEKEEKEENKKKKPRTQSKFHSH